MTLLVTDELYLRHESPGHPECPERLAAMIEHLKSCGLWDRVSPLPARDATDEELRLVHTDGHVRRIRALAERAPLWIDADTYMNEHSLAAALRAAGGVVAACEAIDLGRDTSALCLVRPPGHHATPDRAMGFCLFNNVAIAARKLKRRVLIVDWDVHHGNGTQDIFWSDRSVYYVSTHRWPFYPGTGHTDERGCGNLFNLPMSASTPTNEFLAKFEKGLNEAAAALRPEFVLISCGFDAYAGDPIGGLGLKATDYARMTEIVRKAAPVPTISVLEGGYALEGLGPCVEQHLGSLLR